MEKSASFSQRCFLHKQLQSEREGLNVLTKDMDQLYKRTCFEIIYIKYFIPQQKRRSREAIIIPEQNSTKKTQRKNGVQ